MKSFPCFISLCLSPLLVSSYVCLPANQQFIASSPLLKLRATTSENILECAAVEESDELKRQLFQLGASFDRGFGASPSARQQADKIIAELESCNTEKNASRGISGESSTTYSPLQGAWRMIWTSAVDVLFLEASPIFTVGAIYQVFEPPIVTNVIDLIPRAQSLFPPSIVPSTMFRVKVKTRGSERKNDKPNRVGLVFEAVQFQPLQVLGMNIDVFPPLGFDLPKLPNSFEESSPGFFDVTFLDQELLIIRQNDPGGLFALVKVDSIN